MGMCGTKDRVTEHSNSVLNLTMNCKNKSPKYMPVNAILPLVYRKFLMIQITRFISKNRCRGQLRSLLAVTGKTGF